MAFVHVKCPNCGGNIELDDRNGSGFCTYCGSKVIFKEAVQRTGLSGNETAGIASLDTLLKNAETFHDLGDYEKEAEVLTSITEHYPGDYRGWWRLALQAIESPYDRNENAYGELEPYRFSKSYKEAASLLKRGLFYVRRAIQLAPESEKQTIMQKTKEWYEGYLLFFQGGKTKMDHTAQVSAGSQGGGEKGKDASFAIRDHAVDRKSRIDYRLDYRCDFGWGRGDLMAVSDPAWSHIC